MSKVIKVAVESGDWFPLIVFGVMLCDFDKLLVEIAKEPEHHEP